MSRQVNASVAAVANVVRLSGIPQSAIDFAPARCIRCGAQPITDKFEVQRMLASAKGVYFDSAKTTCPLGHKRFVARASRFEVEPVDAGPVVA